MSHPACRPSVNGLALERLSLSLSTPSECMHVNCPALFRVRIPRTKDDTTRAAMYGRHYTLHMYRRKSNAALRTESFFACGRRTLVRVQKHTAVVRCSAFLSAFENVQSQLSRRTLKVPHGPRSVP